MKPIDERQPEEQDPQYEELMTLLQKVNLDPRLVDPQERTRILAQARARLFQTNPEIFKHEHIAAPALREPGSFPSKLTALAGKPLRGRRLPHVLNMLVAVLVIAVLLGASLLLFQLRFLLTRNHFTNSTGADASCVAKNGMMFGFDAQHTNANPFERILNPTTVGDLKEKWTFRAGGPGFSSPAVVGGVVYVGSDDHYVYALDAVSGAKKWAFRTGDRGGISSSPAVVGGVVYVTGSINGNLYALDATSGAKKWTVRAGGLASSSPAVVGGVVYVGSIDGVVALDAVSGAKKWVYHTGYYSVESSPAVVGGVVYAGSYDGKIYALDAASGMKKWAYRTGGHMEDGTSPTVAGGLVYVGSTDGNVYALDAVSGVKKWAFRTGYITSSPAVAEGMVYVGTSYMVMYAFHLPGT
jgi:glucose dehydrogenase